MSEKKLEGQVAWISGAASGMGPPLPRALLRLGPKCWRWMSRSPVRIRRGSPVPRWSSMAVGRSAPSGRRLGRPVLPQLGADLHVCDGNDV